MTDINRIAIRPVTVKRIHFTDLPEIALTDVMAIHHRRECITPYRGAEISPTTAAFIVPLHLSSCLILAISNHAMNAEIEGFVTNDKHTNTAMVTFSLGQRDMLIHLLCEKSTMKDVSLLIDWLKGTVQSPDEIDSITLFIPLGI